MLRKYKQALLWFRLSDKDYTTARDNNVSPVGNEPNLYSKTYRARRKISWILTIQRSIVSHDLQFARFFSLTLIISYQIHIFHSILSSSDDKYVFHRYFRQEQYSPESTVYKLNRKRYILAVHLISLKVSAVQPLWRKKKLVTVKLALKRAKEDEKRKITRSITS